MCEKIAKIGLSVRIRGESALVQSASDTGNAERLLALHGALLLYCPPWRKWLIWNGAKWALDERDKVRELIRETIVEFGTQALEGRREGASGSTAWKSLDTPKLS